MVSGKSAFAFSYCMIVMTSIYSQNYNFINYTSKHGLPSSEVFAIAQDSSDYIWFATDAGVARFDGSKFVKYTTKDGLADNTVFEIFVDRFDRIWFATFSGAVSCYNHGTFFSIPASPQFQANRYTLEFINSIYVDEQNTLWLGYSSRTGVVWYKNKHDVFSPHSYALDTSLHKHIVQIGTDRFPICAGIFSKNRRQFGVYEGGSKQVYDYHDSPSSINRMHVQSTDSLLYFSYFDCVYIIKGNKLMRELKMSSYISDIYVDPNGFLWIGVFKNGLYKYNNVYGDQLVQKYLNGSTVTNMMYDKEMGLWITTLESGVYYAPSTLIQRMNTQPIADLTFTSAAGHGSNLFLSTSGGYVYSFMYDHLSGTFRYNNILLKLPVYIQKLMIVDQDLIIATSKNTLVFDLKSKKSKPILTSGRDAIVKDLFLNDDHSINASGVSHYFKIDQEYQIVYQNKVPVRAHSVAQTSQGQIYIGTMDGVWQLVNDQFIFLGEKDSLLGWRTDDIMEDSFGNVWFVTREAGVVVKIRDRFYHIDKRKGLVSNQCSGIVQDSIGHIWISTFEGLSKIIINKGIPVIIENYTIYNGLNSNEIRCILAYRNCILLINNTGVDYFDFTKSLKSQYSPPVYIEAVQVDGNPVRYGEPELNYKNHVIEFYFSSLTFSSMGNKTYMYMLDGYDDTQHFTNNNSIRYTNLPAGDYTFLVYGINSNGTISRIPDRMHFVVAAPWWRTFEFYVIVVMVILFVLTGSIVIYSRIIKSKAEKKARVDFLLAESRLIALRAQMNPHFIFNVINSIQYFVLRNDKDKAYDYLSRFSRLIRLVLDSSKYIKIPLSKEMEILKYYTELEKLRFGNELSIQISVETSTNADELMIPNMLLQPYLENAIIHGLMPKKINCRLNILIQEKEGSLYVTIEDNGIGRKRSAENKRSNVHPSAGMMITSERLKVIQSLSEVDVKVNVIDLYDAASNPSGTKIELIIPI